MHAFEERQRKEGKPVNHEFAKELIASFAGAEVDKLVETKGLDYVDKEKAKHQAKQNAERLYDEQVSIVNPAPFNETCTDSISSTASMTSTTLSSRARLSTSSASSVVTTTTKQLNSNS